MAVKMRLTRVGSKKNPIYRVVVADSRAPRDGRFIDIVGRYNPQLEPSLIELDESKVRDWLGKGAQPTESVRRLLKTQNLGWASSCSSIWRGSSSTRRTLFGSSAWSATTRSCSSCTSRPTTSAR